MWYIQNKYNDWYFNLVNSRQELNRNKKIDLFEKHHIRPKSCDGNNSKKNLVLLTPKEHYIAHCLLIKMLEGQYLRSMTYAFCMIRNISYGNNKKQSKLYQRIREDQRQLARELMNKNHQDPDFTKRLKERSSKCMKRFHSDEKFQKEHAKRKSEQQKRKWEDPEYRIKMIQTITERSSTPEAKERFREIGKSVHKDGKIVEKCIKRFKDPIYIEQTRQKNIKRLADPASRAKHGKQFYKPLILDQTFVFISVKELGVFLKYKYHSGICRFIMKNKNRIDFINKKDIIKYIEE